MNTENESPIIGSSSLANLIDVIKDLQNQSNEIKLLKVEPLAKLFEAHDPKLSERIRKDGLPKMVFCSGEYYDTFLKYLGAEVKVRKFPDWYKAKNSILFFWHDYIVQI